MYIWRVNRLAADFKAGKVTERQQLYYLLVFVVVSYILSDPYVNSLLAYESLNVLDMLMLPTVIVIAVVGTVYCYFVAQRFESFTGFLPRYICLGLPVMIRIVVLVIVVMLFVFAINEFLVTIPGIDGYLETEQTTVTDSLSVCAIEILYFWYLSKAIKASYA